MIIYGQFVVGAGLLIVVRGASGIRIILMVRNNLGAQAIVLIIAIGLEVEVLVIFEVFVILTLDF